MTVLSAPYTLLRRDGEAGVSRADPPRRPAEVAAALNVGADATEHPASLRQTDVVRLIAERNFAVAFQPVVRLVDRCPVSYEALLRLRPSPGVPNLSTRAFVDAAQAYGFGAALDQAVLDVALAAWPQDAAIRVSVNVSARSLQDPVFFARLLGRAGAQVAVEITGIADRADLPALTNLVPALRCSGIRVTLDDFSASDLCLACVQAARFDEVKFSSAMVADAAAGPRGQKLLRALVALAGATGARTVAKLIETATQAALMQELGVACGQGWLFGAPVLATPGRHEPSRAA